MVLNQSWPKLQMILGCKLATITDPLNLLASNNFTKTYTRVIPHTLNHQITCLPLYTISWLLVSWSCVRRISLLALAGKMKAVLIACPYRELGCSTAIDVSDLQLLPPSSGAQCTLQAMQQSVVPKWKVAAVCEIYLKCTLTCCFKTLSILVVVWDNYDFKGLLDKGLRIKGLWI